MYCRNCLVYTTEKEHHMMYKSRGGSDDPINLVRLCGPFDNKECEDGCHGKVHRQPWLGWTKQYRTFSWQNEGETEADVEENRNHKKGKL